MNVLEAAALKIQTHGSHGALISDEDNGVLP